MRWTASAFTSVALVSLLGLAFLLPEAEKPPENGPVFAFADPEIDESSGLVALGPGSGDLVLTVNDSGDEARVFAVDPATGETVGTTRWEAEVEDVEALAPAGPVGETTEVWAADIGDNYRRRDKVVVHRVPVGRGDRVLGEDEVATYRLVYPDGAHDAETLLVHPVTGRLLVASKELLGGGLYRAPRALRADVPNELTRVGDLPAVLTDGAFLPDGRHLVLRSYSDAHLYSYPALEPVGEFPLPSQRQGEGVAVTEDGGLLVSTEGKGTDVLALSLPARLADAVAQRAPPPTSAERQDDGQGPASFLEGRRTGLLLAAGAAAALLLVLLLVRRMRAR